METWVRVKVRVGVVSSWGLGWGGVPPNPAKHSGHKLLQTYENSSLVCALPIRMRDNGGGPPVPFILFCCNACEQRRNRHQHDIRLGARLSDTTHDGCVVNIWSELSPPMFISDQGRNT